MAVADPVEAEAVGAPYVSATYAGRDWLIPTDLDAWPLQPVADCLAVTDKQKLVVNYPILLMALQLLLGEQWPQFREAAPKRRHLVPASHAFAAAVGVPRDEKHPMDLVFGAIPRLMFDLKMWPRAVEATLQCRGLDYRDRFRRDEDGRRRLTLRQIHVHLGHAPYDSPLVIAKNDGRRPLSDAALAVYDLFEAMTGQTHPARTFTSADARKRQSAAQTKAEKIAEYKAKRTPAGRRKTALDIAQANAQVVNAQP